ncbi:MAG: ATP-binding protein [Firmicutes bacterium]|nr:ATP-binding protein [Bacillota bacterium]MCL5040180.1 ATP-binding protein [Bacillota bacterium]
MFFRSITWRLTVWYTLILALILLAVGGLTYWAVESTLTRQGIERVLTKNEALRQQLVYSSHQEEGQHLDLTDRDLLATGDAFYLQITDRDGHVLNHSPNTPGFPLPAEPTPAGPVFREFAGRPFLYLSQPLLETGRQVYTLEIALPWETNEEFLRALRRFLTLSGSAGLFLALVGGFLVARFSLRPVAAITRAATAISQEDLSQRLDLSGSNDELRRLAQAFNEMLDRLQKAFEEQKRFVGDASHELRTPLAVVRGYAGLLQRWGQEDPAILREAVAAIKREAEFLSRMVERLLLLARGDSGSKVSKEMVPLDELLAEVAGEIRVLAPEIDFQVGPFDKMSVLGDGFYLRQLFMILLDNAFKYTAPGGQVALSLSRQRGQAVIAVSDTGEGIPAEEIPRIFDRFYRVDKARSRQKGGSGLGLAIARWIVESHDGTIEVRSQVGAGTTFTVKLPIL